MLITHAAIMFQNGEIIEGHSYGKISALALKLGIAGDKVNGFLTSMGEFVLPDEALKIASEAHQISKAVETLTPDDLWPQQVEAL